jgi:hypothetical protein
MKVYHVVHSQPIGSSFIAYTERPELRDPGAGIKSWVEEIDLEDLAKRFVAQVKARKAQRNGQNTDDLHCMLEVRK